MAPKVPAAKKGEKRAGKAKSAPMDGSANKKRKAKRVTVFVFSVAKTVYYGNYWPSSSSLSFSFQRITPNHT